MEKTNKKQRIQELSLEDIMGDRFGRYSKYIIQERALPDIRDGLKPVQRRILYAMNLDGNTYDKGFRKSAKSVGNVMGNFHPHGDSSIYEAMVRLSQNWKLREPLIEMHGNNGSMDGDPPAAMRYTEARLSKISGELLKDINKDTVDMVLNFDDTANEPTVLPAKFPNLLVNGATGISAGYATEIPPHNLKEVIDGTIALIDDPEADLAKLMTIIKGPDFPTGGILQGIDGIKSAYETGRGKVVLRSKTQIVPLRGHKSQIEVSEIPYEVNKAVLVKKIDELRVLKKVEGIAEVRDESDRNGLSVVIELKKDADGQGILNYLFKNTDLQISYNFNMVAIDNMAPKQVGLIRILKAYIAHQEEVIIRRSNFDLDKANKRLHIVQGLIKALSILDDVIKTIRASENKSNAKENLVKKFDFTEEQAEAIVSLQLYRLTNTDVTELEKEDAELNKQIKKLTKILNNKATLMDVIKKELESIRDVYGNDRLTKIEEEVENIQIDKAAIIPHENVRVLVSNDGYIKRSSIRSYTASGDDDNGLKDEDFAVFDAEVDTLDHLFVFTNRGNLIYRPVHEIDDVRWKDTGTHLSQEVGLESDEKIINVFAFNSLDEKGSFVFGTNDSYIKQVLFKDLEPGRTYKTKTITAMKMHSSDSKLIHAYYVNFEQTGQTVYAFTRNSYALAFDLEEVPIVGAKAAGVKFVSLKEDDIIVNFVLSDTIDNENLIALVTQRGSYKQMKLREIPITSRARRGVVTLRELKSNPHRVQLIELVDTNAMLEITTDKNNLIEINVSEHSSVDRYSNGTFILDTESDGLPLRMKVVHK
ncbi:DNA topoisomerase IV subunit A [Lactobacillus sp. YT155]|uniref:DNA topoisomerase IV subunit A n=1 Tax=Lactobacillus sp. YT155 TaxID=3060955 RepID=UPI00265DB4BD|nr:DNA topoisomerase IV subunit A [Lactobacillus sp. YT155]MDO1605409.1 DNA topoisomerase IV subunit A [Lactobacillus sp. YT155]